MDRLKKLCPVRGHNFKEALKLMKLIWQKIIQPQSKNEDEARREFILNILSLSSIGLCSLALIIAIIDKILTPASRGLGIIPVFLMLAAFTVVYSLNKRRKRRLASLIFLCLYFLPTTYFAWRWGVELPIVALFYTLILIMATVIRDTKTAIIGMIIISWIMIMLSVAQIQGNIHPNLYWKNETLRLGDTAIIIIILGVIVAVSWLFGQEIEKSLRRARNSESALSKEKDLLELKVAERTREIKKLQAEKINHLYHLAEFGRLSSGIFHDLVNPLTAVNLNLSQIKIEGSNENKLEPASRYLSQAMLAAEKMGDFLSALKKQIRYQSTDSKFNPAQETEEVLKILNYKINKAGVNIKSRIDKDIYLTGDAAKFSQVAMNLVANAIDAYDGRESNSKIIKISLFKKLGKLRLVIKDEAGGIVPENLNKIFTPFFSTKAKTGQGLGIGLFSAKHIIEKVFHGRLSVKSQLGVGTMFIAKIPINKNAKK